jgi:hypothetical protein
MSVLRTNFLTASPVDYTARASHPGMAHFANSGPQGKTCRACAHWDSRADDRGVRAKPARCTKFFALTRTLGAKVPGGAGACRYFSQAAAVPERFAKK